MANSQKHSADYIPTLDGWRAIAISLVITSHELMADQPIWKGLGAFGVNIFFGLSGFLICTRLLKEYDRTGHISLGRFYIRRIFRILPASWCYLVVIGCLGLFAFIKVSTSEILSCVLMCRNYSYYDFPLGWYTGHYWSLAVEEHFYFIMPALLLVCRPRFSPLVFAAAAIGVVFWRLLDGRQQWSAFILPVGLHPNFRSDTRLDSLFWGCWTAAMNWRYRPPSQGWIARSLYLGAGAFVIFELLWPGLLYGSISSRVKPEWIIGVFQNILPTIAIPIVIAATSLCPKDLPGRLLELAPLRFIGRLSYSLYLWQQLFFVADVRMKSNTLGLLQEWPYNLPALFVCAFASYYLIERPLIHLGHRLTKVEVKLGEKKDTVTAKI